MILKDAQTIAEALKQELSPHCLRCEIAGGVRRGKPDPHDIELVVIPKPGHPPLEFGQRNPILKSVLDQRLWQMEHDGLLRMQMGGDKYRKYHLDPERWNVNMGPTSTVQFDLFLVNTDTWGAQFTIRTGPAEFSHWLVTPKRKGGAMPDGWCLKDGRLLNSSGIPIATPEENGFFEALSLPWTEPADRKPLWGSHGL